MSVRKLIWFLMALLPLAVSCRDANFSIDDTSGGGVPGEPDRRQDVKVTRNVMVMVSGGHNNLCPYLTADLQEMAEGYLPQGDFPENQVSNVLMILSRLKENGFSTTSVPVLYRLYRDLQGNPVRDTLMVWGSEDRMFSGTVIKDALTFIHDTYPADSYGMVVSSHASGWLPPYYYNNPSAFEKGPAAAPRSIGQDDDNGVSVEMDLMDFTNSIPFRLNYLVLDCCLSGGVEVAWALRGKVDRLAFTQTETMAEGFDYSKIVSRLVGSATPDPMGVCQDFYEYYMAQTGVMQSATISFVEMSRLDALASVCATLFDKYRAQIAALTDADEKVDPYDYSKGYKVQRYFRDLVGSAPRHYFYDLKDILVKAGITAGEEEQLDAALQACIQYKAATPWFMDNFPILHHCGLSMYLPARGSAYLDTYYKENIAWNQATQLVL